MYSRQTRQLTGICVLLVLIAGCSPAAPTTPVSGGSTTISAPQAAPPGPTKTLVLMTRSEPNTLAGNAFASGFGSSAGRRRLFNAGLTLLDGALQPMPYLAEALPQLNSDSWRVYPDGRMETTYRLRANLTWHDGQPLTADDFVFAWQIFATPEFGQAGTEPIAYMEEVVAPDPRTLVIRWRTPYPEAGVLESIVSSGTPTGGPGFTAVPRHLLGRVYEEQRETLLAHPYWTVEFVGAGPYRVERWEPGAYIEAAAFDQHVLGRPKIDRVRLVWNMDQNVVLANLLGDEVHLPVDSSIGVSQGIILRQEWAGRNSGTVEFTPKFWRHLAFQFRPDYANPRAIGDIRVRKALAHTVDKVGQNEGVYEGVALPSDSMMPPTVPYFQELDRTVPKYPYDERRAEALMQEAGFRKGPSGFYEHPTEGRPQFQVRANAGVENATQRAILAADWRRAGFDVEEAGLSAAEASDGQTVSTFRSIQIGGAPAGIPAMSYFSSGTVAGPANRWAGGNRGGYAGPEYDRSLALVQSTLDPTERGRAVIQLVSALFDQMGAISLLLNPIVNAFPAQVKGIDLRAGDADQTWNIYQWELP